MPKLSIADKKAALQKQLEEIEAKEKEEHDNKCLILGRAVLNALEQDTELKTRVEALLSLTLKKNTERQLFGLDKLPTNRGRKATETA